ncbi:ABC transporter permease [Martelella alba]|uniref:ABC transporter permease n=1 Tax=Martelella alba TaxID=2590451 RepID=A0A506UH32_9HYPH|nr:ABC transporter permease [Martelella alba]TPW32107.1 ABC transporter permease [Martelella alba]
MSDNTLPAGEGRSLLVRILDSDLWYSFSRSPVAIISAFIFLVLTFSAIFAGVVAPHNPFLAPDLMNGLLPPMWEPGGVSDFPLGTDDQGRGVLSLILYGMRVSLFVGLAAVLLSAALGLFLGLLAGFFGGVIDAFIMRVADIQLSFPNILVALLIDGIVSATFGHEMQNRLALPVLILAIGLSDWVQYARTVRGSTLVERRREYVQAARIMHLSPVTILFRHILPNIMGPVVVIGTLGLANAIIAEATLSFLGVGLPPTRPSLGTLIRTGNDYLFSGEWWITVWPALALVLLSLSVNVFGDWLRDALNPRIKG